MKKLLCVLLCCVMLSCFVVPISAESVDTSAEAFVLYCPDNGEVLLSSNSERELPIASTTKIMTTLLTLEEAAVDNRTVEFTDEMTAEGSSMYLKIGEKVTLYDLAVGMMMQSGNDAANAAAISIAGSMEAFADRMNDKAHEIGMEHTHFVTPSGLDDEGHYSCAKDMALLMAYAMENEDFSDIASQTSMEVRFLYPADKFITYPNHNKLLRMYENCIGGKTGYTDAAGRCLVTAARKDGLTLIAVTLNDRDDWNDHIALYEYGFERYQAVTLSADQVDSIHVVGGDRDMIKLEAEQAVTVIPKEDNKIQTRIKLPPFLYAPVRAGDNIGKVVYSLNGETIATVELNAAESVNVNQKKRSFINYIKDLLNWHN